MEDCKTKARQNPNSMESNPYKTLKITGGFTGD